MFTPVFLTRPQLLLTSVAPFVNTGWLKISKWVNCCLLCFLFWAARCQNIAMIITAWQPLQVILHTENDNLGIQQCIKCGCHNGAYNMLTCVHIRTVNLLIHKQREGSKCDIEINKHFNKQEVKQNTVVVCCCS